MVMTAKLQREERKLRKIESGLFQLLVHEDPVASVNAGLAQGGNHVPIGTRDAEIRRINLLKKQRGLLDAVRPSLLPKSRAIDHEALCRFLRRRLFELEEVRLWESSPNVSAVVGASLSQLLLRNYAPLVNRLRSINDRLQQLPKFVQQSMTRLVSPVKIHVETELESLTYLPGFFHRLNDIAREHLPESAFHTLHQACEKLQNALEIYANWLIIDIIPNSRSDYALGSRKYTRLLELMDVREPPAAILRRSSAELQRLRAKLRALARKFKRNATIEEARETIRGQHPAHLDDILKFSREALLKAKQFVVRSNFATLPPEEDLYVVETPHHLRHLTPFTTYLSPAKFEPKRYGYLCVTPGNSENNKLKEHNNGALTSAAVMDGYPGRHLHWLCALSHASASRLLAAAPEAEFAWALYCEERVREYGFEETAPFHFINTLHQARRALLSILDVKLHTGAIEVKEAADLLSRETGMDMLSADSEIRFILLNPGLHTAALRGRESIKALKRQMRQAMKGKFNERFFHDALLSAGFLTGNTLRKELAWRTAEALKRAQ
ncbi:MAG: hypothetical protein A2Z34_00155 [Planctomycetes bacterium RBG_16_59_8]|nr:MAG: hypothetical protein A2Z34_00155 [Planctomycetes bacterium RBG_16_59_8]